MRAALFSVVVLLAAACSAAPGANRTATPAAPATVTPAVPSLAGPHYTISLSSGGFLVDEGGMTLYTFDNDTGNTSSCYDQCATNWPPVISPNNAPPLGDSPTLNGTLATVARTDDSGFQVSYKGDPLYYYAGDTAAGQTNGDGIGGVWHLAGLASTAAPSAAPASSSQDTTKPASTDCYGYYCDDY